MRSRRILIVQLLILGLSIFAVAELAANFPYPSPLVKPFLPPNLRWPTEQVKQWVETGNIGSDFLEFFARDPERHVPQGASWVSPADGVVQNVEFRDGVTYLVVGLSFWDVHVVRTPVAGVVKDVEPDGYYVQRDIKSKELQESIFLKGKAAPVQQIVTIGTDNGDAKVRLITSYWASRIKVWVHPGQHLDKGQRLGRMLLGSTVVAEMPGRLELSAHNGERVVGGETVILQDKAKP